jgi:hypothetical protein
MNELDNRLHLIHIHLSTLRHQIEATYTKLHDSINQHISFDRQTALINSHRNQLLKKVDIHFHESFKLNEKPSKLVRLYAPFNIFNIDSHSFISLIYQTRLKIKQNFGFYQKFKYLHLDSNQLEPVNLPSLASQRTFSIINLGPNRFFIYNYTLREFGLYISYKSQLKCVKKIKLKTNYHFLQHEFQNSRLVFNLTTSSRNEKVYIYVFDTDLNLVRRRLMKNRDFISYRVGSECIFYKLHHSRNMYVILDYDLKETGRVELKMDDGLVNYLHTVIEGAFVVDYFNSSDLKVLSVKRNSFVKIRPKMDNRTEFSFMLVDRRTRCICLIQREACTGRYVLNCYDLTGRLVMRRDDLRELFGGFDSFFVYNETIHFIRNEKLTALF